MKFLFFTDTHIRGNNPQNRIDDFVQTLNVKLREVFEIAKNEEVDIILHGGDIFDRRIFHLHSKRICIIVK